MTDESSTVRRLAARPSVWIAVVLVSAAAIVFAVRARGPLVATTIAAKTDIEQHVIASGRVWVVTRVQVSAQTGGRVLDVRVAEGQRVQSGDVLIQMDDAEARAAVAQARAGVAQSAGRVDQLRHVAAVVTTEASRQAQTNLTRAEAELARVDTLAAAGGLARVDVEDARRNVDIARAQKTAADAQRTAATPAGVDTTIATSARLESQSRLDAALARLSQTRLLAPRNGVILQRAVEPGDTVQPGVPLLELAADGETQLIIEPDERNLTWIRVGQRARASADAYPAQIFDAEVSAIAPAVDARRGSIEVRLRVTQAPPILKPDMTVSVDLTVAEKRQVLTLPTDAIRGAATPTPWVLVVDGGLTARRDVTLGIRGAGSSEIASGLADGAEVVTSTDLSLVPGLRVRTTRSRR